MLLVRCCLLQRYQSLLPAKHSDNIKTVDGIQLGANKNRQEIAKEVVLLFSKTTHKLTTGNECAHQLHEKCFTTFAENDAKVKKIKEKLLKIKEKLEELLKKHKQLYKFRANLKTSSRRVKVGKRKARTRKIKRRKANIDEIFASISSSYKSSGTVEELDPSKGHPSPSQVDKIHARKRDAD